MVEFYGMGRAYAYLRRIRSYRLPVGVKDLPDVTLYLQ